MTRTALWGGLGILFLACSANVEPELNCPEATQLKTETTSHHRKAWCEIQTPSGARLRHGPERYWHGNGKLAFEAHYLQGKEDGKRRFWTDQGQKSMEEDWRYGAMVRRQSWFDTGKMREEITFPTAITRGRRILWNELGAVTLDEELPELALQSVTAGDRRRAPALLPVHFYCANDLRSIDGSFIYFDLHQTKSGTYEVYRKSVAARGSATHEELLAEGLYCQIPQSDPYDISCASDEGISSRFCAWRRDDRMEWVAIDRQGRENFGTLRSDCVETAIDFNGVFLAHFDRVRSACQILLTRHFR